MHDSLSSDSTTDGRQKAVEYSCNLQHRNIWNKYALVKFSKTNEIAICDLWNNWWVLMYSKLHEKNILISY